MRSENLKIILYWIFDIVLLAAIVFLMITLKTWWPLFLVMMVPSRIPKKKEEKKEKENETKFN